MARPRKTDIFDSLIPMNAPDTEKLAFLVSKAKGERSVAEFASLCGVNASTMSRLINNKNSTPSSDELIFEVAVNADPKSGVTFQHLANALGYEIHWEEYCQEDAVKEKYQEIFNSILAKQEIESYQNKSMLEGSEERFAQRVKNIIQLSLLDHGYSILSSKNLNTSITDFFQFDFIINTDALEGENLTSWAFDVKAFTGMLYSNYAEKLFCAAYLNAPRKNGMRLTIVVCDSDSYYKMREYLKMFEVYDSISVMWVDIVNNCIGAEYVINNTAGVEPVRLFDEGRETNPSDEEEEKV